MRAPKILIATSRHDGLNYQKVVDVLKAKGCEVTIFEPDSIASGVRAFSMHIDANGKLTQYYDGQSFDLASFDAVWYRRPSYYGEHRDHLRWLSLKDEYMALQKAIWELIPDEKWLNSPRAMQRADQKLAQLIKASEAGFCIPQTVVSNKWEAIESLENDQLIVKMMGVPVLYEKEGRKTLPSTIVAKSALPKDIPSYPGMWQPYIPKKREWRVTVVGEQVFSAAIYTTSDAKADWRMHQEGPGVTFKAEPFPEEFQQKCHALLQKLSLRYGAFDFIEMPDGQIIYLEVNSNGQFMWLEDKLGLTISEAIADELIAIANAR